MDEVMENAHRGDENRYATIAELRELLDTVRLEIMRRENERQVVISTEETNQEILHLCQEILRLKEASSGGQATQGNPVNIFANHTREPKISLPEKFDGTRSK